MTPPFRIALFIACVLLVPAVTARHNNFRREVTCEEKTMCTDENQDKCCVSQQRCCDKKSNKDGRCPSARVNDTGRANMLSCVFDGDCPRDEKCCQPKQYCMVDVDAENDCPRIRVFGDRCEVCAPAGHEIPGLIVKRCCPDGLKGNRGVCMPPFIPTTPGMTIPLSPAQMFCVTFDDSQKRGSISAKIQMSNYTMESQSGNAIGGPWNKPAKR